jgi:hypothetical protein
MTAPRTLLAIAATTAVIHAAAASAAAIDMDDPRRALGREGDVRVDAQIIQEVVSPGSPIGVTYQIENLTSTPVGIAHRIAAASYDSDTQTITLAIGAEVPQDGRMPHMVMIGPGEKKVLTAGATPALTAAIVRTGGAPRLVQIKVSILRNTEPFAAVIARQDPRNGIVLSDEQFEKWFESNDTIFLNSVPVRYSPRGGAGRENHVGADRRSSSSASF